FRPSGDQLSSGWWTVFKDPSFTLENYRRAMFDMPGGYVSFSRALLNSFAIAIPGTVIPILMAAAAASGLAWTHFNARRWLFITVVALTAIPLQMALVPLLQFYSNGAHLTLFDHTTTLFPNLTLNGKPAAVWLTHTAFGLPLAIFLLHNYIA